jgi:hypothetical protein
MYNYKYYLILLLTITAIIISSAKPLFANDVSTPFTLSWDRNSESDLAYYRVYYGTSSRNYDNYITVDKQYPSCQFTPDILTVGLTYYITLTAIDFSLNESGYSEEIEVFVESSNPYTTTTETDSYTTTTVPIEQEQSCSTDDVLKLHGSIPEEGTITVTITEDIGNAVSASLFLTLLDADISGEGYIYINESEPIDLPVNWNYDNILHEFEVPVSPESLAPGENTFRFTHVASQGYEVRGLCVSITFSLSPPSTTTSSIPDEAPPTGTVTINNGDQFANSRLATIHLNAEDDTCSMDKEARMMFSNDNITWTPPEPFAPKRYWLLSAGGGEKIVYVKLRDSAGNWMRYPATDRITLEPVSDCLKPAQLDTTAYESSGTFLYAFPKEKAIDGNTDTGWLSPLRFIFMKEEYLTLDLGEAKIINCIDITSKPFLLFNLCPLDFKIQVSLDNIKWSDVVTVEEYSSPPSYSDTWFFDATKARYIKWVITKGRPFLFIFYLSYLSEIEVSGCAATETEPSSAAPAPASTHTKPRVVKSVPGNTPIDNTTPSLNMLKPERPGKPVFLLNNHF